jgi:hypothetical protein
MERQRHHQPLLRMLPHYFKFIGSGVAVLSFIICLIYKVDFGNYSSIREKVLIDMINIGCLLICFAKEKIEDELLILTRLKSAAYTLIISVLYIMIYPLYIYIHDGRDFKVSNLAFVMFSLVIYTMIFDYKKRRM